MWYYENSILTNKNFDLNLDFIFLNLNLDFIFLNSYLNFILIFDLSFSSSSLLVSSTSSDLLSRQVRKRKTLCDFKIKYWFNKLLMRSSITYLSRNINHYLLSIFVITKILRDLYFLSTRFQLWTSWTRISMSSFIQNYQKTFNCNLFQKFFQCISVFIMITLETWICMFAMTEN